MSGLSRLFSIISNLRNRIGNALNTDVDQAAENAKRMMGYYQYRFDIPDGATCQLGAFAIMMDGRDPHSPASPLIEINYRGKRVLRHSSHVDVNGREVTNREVSRDRAWIKPFCALFEKFQHLVTAQETVGTLAPGQRVEVIYRPRIVRAPSRI